MGLYETVLTDKNRLHETLLETAFQNWIEKRSEATPGVFHLHRLFYHGGANLRTENLTQPTEITYLFILCS